jgi:YesN/AraC family two-component response regulator
MDIDGLEKMIVSTEYTPSTLSKNMFYYVQGCGHFYCNKSYCTNRKNYNSFLLLQTINGRGYLKYRDKSYTLEKDQVFLIDCMEEQYYATYGEEIWEFEYIHYNGSESRKYFERIIENSGPVLNLRVNSIILSNIKKISNLINKRDTRIDIMASCHIVEILTEVLILSYNFNMKDDMVTEYVNKAISIIEKEYYNKITLEYISKVININKFYLTKLFKKYTSEGLYEYLINFRINKSKELLRMTNMPIYEISEKVGFESVSNFIKTFKQNEEITPLKFRKLWN